MPTQGGAGARRSYLRVTLVVFSVAAAAFAAGGLVFDGRMDDGGELRDALVPFAALLTGAAVAAICLLVFMHDLLRNSSVSPAARARWAAGFAVFPPTVIAYWWLHGRD